MFANSNLNFLSQPLINIHDFIVSPNFRGQGVGLFLLDVIAKYVKEKGYCRVNLEVRYDNIKAQNLYKKAGFTECDPPNYFWENGFYDGWCKLQDGFLRVFPLIVRNGDARIRS